MKSKEKSAIPSSYRPISCLPPTFKLMTDSRNNSRLHEGKRTDTMEAERQQQKF